MEIATKRSDEEWIPLDDRIWGIEGTFFGLRKAKGYDHDEDLYFVQYTTNTRAGGFLRTIAALLNPRFDPETIVEETPEPIPKSMIKTEKTPDSEAEGVPQFKKVLLRDKDGNQPYQARLGEELGKDVRAATQRKNEEKTDHLREKVKHRRNNSSESPGNERAGAGSNSQVNLE